MADNSQIRKYVSKIENRIVFEIKTGYLLMVKLIGCAKNEITKDKNDENVPHLEINETVLVHCNIVNNDYQHNLFPINRLVNCYILKLL